MRKKHNKVSVYPFSEQSQQIENIQRYSSMKQKTKSEPTFKKSKPQPNHKRQTQADTHMPISKNLSKTTLATNYSTPKKQVMLVEDPYYLSPDLLSNTKITEINRAKLKCWLMQQSAKQTLYRQTYVLASCYLDLYFQRGHTISMSQFQILGLSCFLLAAKTVEGRIPNISYEIFSKETLLKYQELIIQRLDYNITPKTYFICAGQLLYEWDKFIQITGKYKICYMNQQTFACFIRLRSFYQLLDCMNLVLKTHQFNLFDLIANLFFIENKINSVGIARPTSQTSLSQFQKVFYCQDDYFSNFLQFLEMGNHTNPLDKQIGKYILNFYQLPRSQNAIRSPCISYGEYINFQTFNPKFFLVYKNVSQLFKVYTVDRS